MESLDTAFQDNVSAAQWVLISGQTWDDPWPDLDPGADCWGGTVVPYCLLVAHSATVGNLAGGSL